MKANITHTHSYRRSLSSFDAGPPSPPHKNGKSMHAATATRRKSSQQKQQQHFNNNKITK